MYKPSKNLSIHKFFTKKNALSIIIFLWSFLVLYTWIQHHNYYIKTIIQFKLFGAFITLHHTFPFWFGLSIAIIITLFYIFLKKYYHNQISLSPFSLAIIVYLFIILLYAASIYIRVNLPQLAPIFTGELFFSQMTQFLYVSFKQIFWIFLTTYILYLYGEIVITIPFFKKILNNLDNNLSQKLLIFGFGIIALTSTVFFLTIFHILYAWIITAIALFIFLIKLRYLKKIIKLIFHTKINIPAPATFSFWISFLLIILFSIVFIDSLYAHPQGFDATTEYLTRAKNIALSHTLIPRWSPSPYSLLMAIPYLYSNNAFFVFGTNIIFAILGFLGLYVALSMWTKNNNIILATTTLLYTTPLTTTYLHFEPKVELLLLFIATLCTILATTIFQKPTKQILYYILAIFCGYLISIKLTAGIFLFALFIPLLYIFLKTHRTKLQKIKIILLTLTLVATPLVPWFAHTIYTYNTPHPFQSFLQKKNPVTITMPENLSQNNIRCKDTSVQDDFSRYDIDIPHPILSPIIIPWRLMINDTVIRPATMTEIGFIYTLFWGLLIASGFVLIHNKKHALKQKTVYITVITILYWVLWSIFCKYVIWYGYPGFIFLSIIIVLLLHFFEQKKYSFIYIMLLLLIIFNISTNILTRSKTYLSQNVISYIQFNNFPITAQNIVSELNAPDNLKKKIYMPVMPIIYDIDNQSQRIITDPTINTYDCIMQKTNNDYDYMLHYLKENNISYVIHSFTGEISENDKKNRPNITKKMISFREFCKLKLKLIIKENGMALYIVP